LRVEFGLRHLKRYLGLAWKTASPPAADGA
jgi:hypothetical protein